MAAACLLDAFGWQPSDNIVCDARAYVGAMLLMQCMREITVIRRALTESK